MPRARSRLTARPSSTPMEQARTASEPHRPAAVPHRNAVAYANALTHLVAADHLRQCGWSASAPFRRFRSSM